LFTTEIVGSTRSVLLQARRSLKRDLSLEFFGPLEITGRHKGQLQRLLAI
jgi:hypothetical protein